MTMPRQNLEYPLRLREEKLDPASIEARAAAHLGRCAEIEIPQEPVLELCVAVFPRRRWLPVPVAASIIVLGLVCAGLAGAVGVRRLMVRAEEREARAGDGGRGADSRPARRAQPEVPESPVPPEQPTVEVPAPALTVPARSRPAARRPEPTRGSSQDAETAVPQPSASPLADETALLEGALRKLRRDRDATGALAALEGYERRFPHGLLVREADTTRVEAFLALGRGSAALGVLDHMSFGASPRDTDLLLTRGTLRADARRCPEAEDDLTQVLSRASSSRAIEHALWTRASCRSRRADWAGARLDLEGYLQRFPDGRFSSEARRALSTM